MKKILIHPTYFPNIIQFTEIYSSDEIIFEINDFYDKQTYRSRMYIQSPNGKQMLSIPVKHTKSDGKQYYKDVKISYDFDWQKLHWRSLETAYRTSPYFEFYEDDIRPLVFNKEKYLTDYNLNIIHKLLELLEIENKLFDFTEKFKENYPQVKDLRVLKEAKKTIPIENQLPVYTQVFSDRFDFMPNLSFLDLLFMEGPNAMEYLDEVATLGLAGKR